jgi:hypothetical protein
MSYLLSADPSEMTADERWIADLFEPIRLRYYVPPCNVRDADNGDDNRDDHDEEDDGGDDRGDDDERG